MRLRTVLLATSLLVGAATGSAFAGPSTSAPGPNVVQNGDFSMASGTTVSTQFGTQATVSNQQFVTDWTGNNGYEIWYPSATAATTEDAVGQYSSTNREELYQTSAPPSGPGTFVGLDGAQIPGVQSSISQTLNGLTVNATYQVSFDWASAQMKSRSGVTKEQLAVSLGNGPAQMTDLVTTPSMGSTPWQTATFDFIASSTSEVLNFLAVGSPSGLPPMSLLTNVKAQDVPEPGSLALLGGGLIGLGLVVRRRRKAAKASTAKI